ncbi:MULTISPECIES: NAD(P)-dependent oxidoreductase [unclassified Mesotoga]|uniref:NAD-dependent epimerase/dehydratase family protein n=1 Tax=unclassified Mesotoga TaxID=1184398 RepID=UPI000DA67BAE|nr:MULTISPECIES: NAD(P)-dependent oxidoreductase [unclassified Mesotoga]PZC51844.1 hypothetical protein LH53_08695 [Mesotoga sp. TolDC]
MIIGITGYSGFVGSRILRLLINDQSIDEIYLIGRQPILDCTSSKLKHFRFDLVTSSESFDRRLDVLIHSAGRIRKTHNDATPDKDYFDTNVYGTFNLINHVKTNRLIYVSTVDVYGENSFERRIDENRCSKPQGVYSATKYLGEEVCRIAYAEENLLVARLGNVYGPGDRSEKLIQTAIKRIKSGQKIKMYGDGSYTRDYIFVEDVASLVVKLSVGEATGIVNVVSGSDHSISETLAMICSRLGVNFDEVVETLDVENPPKSIRFNNQCLKRFVKSFQFTELSKGLVQTID